MQADWPAAEPLIRQLRNQAGLPAHDPGDDTALHLLLYRADGSVAACGRLHGQQASSLCVFPDHQRMDTGAALLGLLAEHARQRGLSHVHIQAHASWQPVLQQLHAGDDPFLLPVADALERWPLAGLTQAVLGQTRTAWMVQKPADYRRALLQLASQAQSSLRLFSPQLEPALFDQAELADALSQLARRSRYTEVRLLMADSRWLVQRRHALVDLYRRLPSRVPLLRLAYASDDWQDTLCLVDGQGFLLKPERDADEGLLCLNDPARTQALTERFDYFWQRAISDTELRRLAL